MPTATPSLVEAGPENTQKWEYMVVPLKAAGGLWKKSVDPNLDRLNDLGRQGWEAVGLSLQSGDLVASPVVLLKRRLG
jgi:hypothetical protein